jgi:hypothetical protein
VKVVLGRVIFSALQHRACLETCLQGFKLGSETLAQTGPHSQLIFLGSGDGKPIKQLNKNDKIIELWQKRQRVITIDKYFVKLFGNF